MVSSADKNLFVPTEKRHIGMVFQSYAIWPHMTVFDNVAYPLEGAPAWRKDDDQVTRSSRRSSWSACTAWSRASGHAAVGRPATARRAGPSDRVRTTLLLLDEPLSNLDAKLRIHMRTELKHLQQQTGITSVFVTHDQAESMALADRIIVMNRGQIEQVGSPARHLRAPAEPFRERIRRLDQRVHGAGRVGRR